MDWMDALDMVLAVTRGGRPLPARYREGRDEMSEMKMEMIMR
jgi:hypothetical protein